MRRRTSDDRAWVELRHVDIDVDAELDAMGAFDDGVLTNREANRWAYETLCGAGYDTTWLLLPDSHHASGYEADDWDMSPQAWQLTVDTVVNAERWSLETRTQSCRAGPLCDAFGPKR